MRLSVKILLKKEILIETDEKISIEVDEKDTIIEVKKIIHEIRQFPVAQQYLVYNGEYLEYGRSLCDYGIIDKSCLEVYIYEKYLSS